MVERVGASVGLEAGYTQLASGIASRIGRAFRLRRADLRILVGCGAAGGIAGAFGAPLAGAFYAFELVIGNYSVTSLAPVAIAALLGYLISSSLEPDHLGIVVPQIGTITGRYIAVAALLGFLVALFGIAIMRGVALCEFVMLRIKHPALRAALGGVVVGRCAGLAGGHVAPATGALYLAGLLDLPLMRVATILLLKALASIVSPAARISGGGLFFASLLLGATAGQLFATVINMVSPSYYFDPNIYAVIGMGRVVCLGHRRAAHDDLCRPRNDRKFLRLTAAVMVAVIVSAQITRSCSAIHSRRGASICAAKPSAVPPMSAGSAISPSDE